LPLNTNKELPLNPENDDLEPVPSGYADLNALLAAFYAAVSKATTFGHFRGHHGPLEETAWLHVAIHELEAIDELAAGVLDRDVRCLARLREVLDRVQPDPQPTVGSESMNSGSQILAHLSPATVATSTLLLERLTDPKLHYVDRARSYYVSRAAAVQQALDAGAAVIDGRAPIDQLEDVIRRLTPRGAMGHGIHSTPAQARSSDDRPHAGRHGLPSGDDHNEAVEVPPLRDIHDVTVPTVASALESVFDSVMRAGSQVPVSAADALLAVARGSALDATAKANVERLASAVREEEPRWRQFLTHDVEVHPHPIVLPDAPRRHRCVPGEPQYGGQWELASLHATETDERCPPGEALHDIGSKVYGAAGAQLIKGQNEWIKAKQCFGEAAKKKGPCITKEDQGYERCDLEEDHGYERCDREEDQGHRDCCDWVPCSWVCDAWTWIKKLVCVLKTWVENWICVASTWIEKWVCVAWAYIVAAGCAIGHIAKAAVHVVVGLGGIAVGAAFKTAGSFVAKLCHWFGIKPSSREVTRLKVVGVHIAMLHTNKVLLFSYDEGNYPATGDNPADFTAIGDSDRALCALWDYRNGTAKYIKLRRNLFCAHQSFAADGRLLVAGGQFPLPGLLKDLFPPRLLAPGADKDVHVFNPVTESWTRLSDMAKGRWYPTCVTLPDGRIFISSGTNGWATERGFGRGLQDTWQIANPLTGDVGSPTPFGFHLYHLFPFQHVLPSEQVFIHFKRTTVLFNPADKKMVRVAADGASDNQTGRTKHPYSRTGGGPGTCVLLPLLPNIDPNTGAVSYPGGRIMILGGGGAEKAPEPVDQSDQEEVCPDGTKSPYCLHSDTPATNTAEILNFDDGPDAQWRFTNEPMHHGRVMPDSVLMPNGSVLVVGGGKKGQSGGLLAHFTSTDTEGNPDKGATDPVLAPELFDPVTETWEELCPKILDRLYHTTALLLPDARVLVAGHDGALNMPPYDSSRYELEIFSPPYLFGANGAPAARPEVVEAPATTSLGERLAIRFRHSSAIASVALIRQSSTTHQINSDQRFVGLAIVSVDGDVLHVQMPSSGGVSPPGYYMLFVVDQQGVPSIAHWIRVAAR
jgi:hypothetical protein